MFTDALIAFDGLGLAILITSLVAALFAVWGAYDAPGTGNFLALGLALAAVAALVAGAHNLLLWYFAWELAIFIIWGFGRWASGEAQTTLGALPLQGLGAVGSLGMTVALLLLALSNRSIGLHSQAVAEQPLFVTLLLGAILLKCFALLSAAWYASRDGQSFFVAQAVAGAVALPVVGLYPYLRFLVINLGQSAEWRDPVLGVTLGLAFLSGVAALGEHDLPKAMAYLIFGQFAGLLARFSLLQPADLALVAVSIFQYALAIVALGLCAARVARASGQRDLRLMGGLAGKMPGTGVIFLLAGLVLAGLPPLGGFAALAATTATAQLAVAKAGYLLFGLGALLALAVLRLFHGIFLKPSRTQPAPAGQAPMPLLAIAGAIVLALLLAGLLPGELLPLLQPAVPSGS